MPIGKLKQTQDFRGRETEQTDCKGHTQEEDQDKKPYRKTEPDYVNRTSGWG